MGLDSVELLYSIEEEFGIEISNLEAEKITTVDDLVNAFYKKISISPNNKYVSQITNKYEVERIIVGIISSNMGIPINKIELHHSITNDLGID